jgi:Uma2 family endonuclease
MHALMLDVPSDFLEERRRLGADRWDEMWDGVLHMAPAPIIEHQDFEFELEEWLRTHWACVTGRRVHHDINVAPRGGWPKNYRIPDIVLLDVDCPAKNRRDYLEGPPTVAIEIHSPGDEAYEKLPFYGELGVPEVWIINRDSRAVEVRSLHGGDYTLLEPAADGWLHSRVGVQLRTRRGRKLAIQNKGKPGTLRLLPDR